jgi:nucleoside-diphosphate-sugar epimerase
MRFDLVINTFVLYGWLRGEIQLFGGGRHWRPFVHVEDCASAFIFFAENEAREHNIFNVSHENLRVRDLAPLMQQLMPGLTIKDVVAESGDSRNYRVSGERLEQAGFRTTTNALQGAEQVLDAIRSRRILEPESQSHWNAKWVQTFALPAYMHSERRDCTYKTAVSHS